MQTGGHADVRPDRDRQVLARLAFRDLETVARQVIDARGLDLSSSARALALMYLAASDAGIACWSARYM